MLVVLCSDHTLMSLQWAWSGTLKRAVSRLFVLLVWRCQVSHYNMFVEHLRLKQSETSRSPRDQGQLRRAPGRP